MFCVGLPTSKVHRICVCINYITQFHKYQTIYIFITLSVQSMHFNKHIILTLLRLFIVLLHKGHRRRSADLCAERRLLQNRFVWNTLDRAAVPLSRSESPTTHRVTPPHSPQRRQRRRTYVTRWYCSRRAWQIPQLLRKGAFVAT